MGLGYGPPFLFRVHSLNYGSSLNENKVGGFKGVILSEVLDSVVKEGILRPLASLVGDGLVVPLP